MFQNLFNKDHICNTAIERIVEIQKPLNDTPGGLHLVSYGKVFDNQTGYIFMTNRPYWLIRANLKVPFPATYVKEGIQPWSEVHSEAFIKIAEDFNIFTPINFIQKTPSGAEAFNFAFSSKENPGLSFYLTHIEMLKSFIAYFKQEAAEIIKKADQSAIAIPSHLTKPANETDESYQVTIQKLVASFRLPEESVDKSNALTTLSDREFMCLCYYLTGKTAKDIAKILTLSPKTVAAHLYNVRIKLDCNNRTELFEKAWALGLIQSTYIKLK